MECLIAEELCLCDPWVLIAGLSVLGLFLVQVTKILITSITKNSDKRINLVEVFITLGVVWFMAGPVYDNPVLWGVGLILLLAGTYGKLEEYSKKKKREKKSAS